MAMPQDAPSLNASEPILAVADVPAAVRFYREVLGFQSEWLWGDPPNFGGVRWGRIQVMFCLQPALAGAVEGHQHAFFCDNVDALRERHRTAGAPVISEPQNKPWGLREYTVRDPNGYHLRFGGPATPERPAGARQTLPDFVRIIERTPTPEELASLAQSVGWTCDEQTIGRALANSLYAVVAVDQRAEPRVVGSARVVGDGVNFFYVQDMMVRADMQSQRIGSSMMDSIMSWLRRTARTGAYVGLFTGRPGFYERYGFVAGNGMSLCV